MKEKMTSDNKIKKFLDSNYTDYIKYLKDKGYNKELITIDQTSEIVSTRSLAKGSIGTVVDIRCPCRHKIIIPGREQLQEDAYALRVMLTDKDNVEIAPDIRIRIVKEKVSQEITIIGTMFYKDLTITRYLKTLPNEFKSESEWYKFDQGIEIDAEQHLRIEVINPDINIDVSNIKLYLDIDLFEEE